MGLGSGGPIDGKLFASVLERREENRAAGQRRDRPMENTKDKKRSVLGNNGRLNCR